MCVCVCMCMCACLCVCVRICVCAHVRVHQNWQQPLAQQKYCTRVRQNDKMKLNTRTSKRMIFSFSCNTLSKTRSIRSQSLIQWPSPSIDSAKSDATEQQNVFFRHIHIWDMSRYTLRVCGGKKPNAKRARARVRERDSER